ncbi:cupin domain-containing protein [Stieleria varia]|uniref:Quercetin 2,3-dioxygenase n=1 Tax=Stieleria varia TaxID=2528005 RepID=A0A5C5ZZU0_9BACT|nr:cupin domain-containing protein [Stieleria varia]TWT92676.1 Quercetin 2,3-dioxygenase [Stieleria varia]
MISRKLVVDSGQGDHYVVLGGDQITIKATAADTNGVCTILETVVPAGAGPPCHRHHRESETFYVIDGDFVFAIGDDTVHAGPGSFLIAPPGIAHQFRNTSDRPGKLLITCHPAGFEDFVLEFAKIPVDAPPDPIAMAAIGEKFGIDFLPPML